MKKFLIILALITCVGGAYFILSQREEKIATERVETLNTNVNKVENKSTKVDELDKILLEKFDKNKKDIIEKLETLKPEKANELYKEYLKNNNKLIYEIETANQKFLDSIYFSDENFTGEDWRTTDEFLNKYGLELWDIGEGIVTIREVHDFYYNIFKDYVSEDYKEYLKIISDEDKVLYQADAGLVVSFKEIGDRIITWENFLKKYPNSDLKSAVIYFCSTYRRDYLLGMENTPTRENCNCDENEIYIYEENLIEFNRFMKEHPDSPTVEFIKFYLDNYKNDDIYDTLSDMLFYGNTF